MPWGPHDSNAATTGAAVVFDAAATAALDTDTIALARRIYDRVHGDVAVAQDAAVAPEEWGDTPLRYMALTVFHPAADDLLLGGGADDGGRPPSMAVVAAVVTAALEHFDSAAPVAIEWGRLGAITAPGSAGGGVVICRRNAAPEHWTTAAMAATAHAPTPAAGGPAP